MNFKELVQVADSVDSELFGDRERQFLLKRLSEEVDELREAADIYSSDPTPKNKLDELKEFGDVLYCLVACSRQYGWDIEQALSLTICKLQERIKFNVYKESGERNGKEK